MSRPLPAALRRLLAGMCLFVAISSCPTVAYAQTSVFIKGADISMLPKVEDNGGLYFDGGAQGDLLTLFQDHGFNSIRLRLWHTPTDGYCNLAQTLAMADRIHSAGMGFLLDIHFSDTWADPGKQYKPGAWAVVPFSDLPDSVYQYTFDVMTALKNNNTLPDMVQVGNEIICGMLWNDGRVCGAYDTPQQWTAFADLLDHGIRGVRDSLDPEDAVEIMIHIDRGGDAARCAQFFDHLLPFDLDYDIIGLSYYPWWHGTLADLEANLDFLATTYGKDIILAETAYPWTLDWYDATHNIVGLPEHLHDGYPATVQGQGDFLSEVIEVVAHAPAGRGRGVYYWAPEHISTPSFGSPWENLALFDFQGELLASVAAFEAHPTAVIPDGGPAHPLNQNFPNPAHRSTTISYSVAESCHVTLAIYDVTGRWIATLLDDFQTAGPYSIQWNGRDSTGTPVASGTYFYRLAEGDRVSSRRMVVRN